jgi:hypothetical protein
MTTVAYTRWQHVRPILLATAYATFAACDIVFAHGLAHACIFGLALIVLTPLQWILATLFVALITLGESFRVPHVGRLSVVHVLSAVIVLKLACTRDVSALAASIRRLRANVPLVLLFIWIVAFGAIGVFRGNAAGDVSEAVLPFAYFGLTALGLETIGDDRWRELRTLLFVSLGVAALKVIFISLFDVNALWDNAWQAARTPIPGSPVARAVLRGGDVFLVMGVLAASAALLFGAFRQRISALITAVGLLPLLAVANFASMTRSNYVGAAAGFCFLALFTLWPRRHVVSKRAMTTLLTTVGVATVVFLALDRYFQLIETFLARTGASADNANATLEWRAEESHSILNAIRDQFALGSGAGTRYVFANAPDGLGTGTFSHNGYLWLLHHYGIVGFVLFGWLTVRVVLRGVRQLRTVPGAVDRAIVAGTVSCWVSLVVLSIAVNKIATISGGFAFGLLEGIMSYTERLRDQDAVAAAS